MPTTLRLSCRTLLIVVVVRPNFNYPRESFREDYGITGVRLSVCLSVCLSVSKITK